MSNPDTRKHFIETYREKQLLVVQKIHLLNDFQNQEICIWLNTGLQDAVTGNKYGSMLYEVYISTVKIIVFRKNKAW